MDQISQLFAPEQVDQSPQQSDALGDILKVMILRSLHPNYFADQDGTIYPRSYGDRYVTPMRPAHAARGLTAYVPTGEAEPYWRGSRGKGMYVPGH